MSQATHGTSAVSLALGRQAQRTTRYLLASTANAEVVSLVSSGGAQADVLATSDHAAARDVDWSRRQAGRGGAHRSKFVSRADKPEGQPHKLVLRVVGACKITADVSVRLVRLVRALALDVVTDWLIEDITTTCTGVIIIVIIIIIQTLDPALFASAPTERHICCD